MSGPFCMEFVIGTLDCDELGHLNVSRYFRFCNRAGFAMQAAIGWPPGEANAGRRYSFAVVTETSEFLAEMHAGEVITAEVGISAMGTKSATFLNVLRRADGSVAYSSPWKSVLMDLDTRRSVELPEDLRAALKTYWVED